MNDGTRGVETGRSIRDRWLPISLIVSLGIFAIFLLICGGWAKTMFMDVIVQNARNPAKRSNTVGPAICLAMAYAGPLQSALLMAFLPFRLLVRVSIAVIWMTVTMLVFSWGNRVYDFMDTPMLFSDKIIFHLPLFTLGVFLSIQFIKSYGGWEFHYLGKKSGSPSNKFTISTVLIYTFLVAACFCPVQLLGGSIGIGSLFVTLAGMAVGLILSACIRLLMSIPPILTLVMYLSVGILTFYALKLIMSSTGAGTLSYGNALFISSILFAILFGVVIARLHGVQLQRHGGGYSSRSVA